jgi:acid phosphatase (class A)
MKLRITTFLFLVLSFFLRAETTNWQLPPNESFLKLIPGSPADGTPAAQADLDYVIALQAHPTKEQLAHAEKSVKFTVFTFAEVRGDSFTAAAYPKTALFFKRLEETADIRKNWMKDIIHRERPYQAFPELVKPMVTIEKGYSCPSGHSTRSWLDALVLGDLDPARRSDYLACAAQVNTDRILGGMHYPSDTVAGRILAEAIHDDLLNDPSFKAELEELRRSEFSSDKQNP